MPLNVYTSNRMENLLDALAGVLKRPLASPFAAELIVMQSKGMQRWLSMELAGRFGVWANCSYPFPNAFVTRLFSGLLPDCADTDAFAPEVLTWKLYGLLPGCGADELFAPLHRYLGDDREDLKRFQLARKLADTFDQYTLYRADMLRRWEQQGALRADEAWQAALWKKLSAGGGQHRGRLKEAFCRQLTTTVPGGDTLPQRVAVFGISYLPAYHLEIIAAAAQVIEVNLFLLSPTREYWADISSPRAQAGLSPAERELRIEGNPLLASLGRLGRDFSAMTIELASLANREVDLYAEPEGDCLLRSIQADILNLSGAEEGRVKLPIAADDESLLIHACHSPLREVEVLHDQLLQLLERNPGLECRDILVMTPDIETYAPFISAVFDGGSDQDGKIPYSIADRRLASEGEVATSLIQLLGLVGSRMTVVQLLDILSLAPVRRCFGLEEDDLATIRYWLEKTRVHWGLDEQDRLKLGLPGYRANSWRAGLDRLLLGYAMADGKGSLFHDLLPYDDMEGASVQLLGRLGDFVDRVGRVVDDLARPRPLAEWGLQLRSLLADFIVVDDATSRESAVIAGIVDELVSLADRSAFEGQVTFTVIRTWVTSRLEQEEKGLGFITGGVTFCAMLPMRSIPFPVIAMLGMNDGAFPRQSIVPGFDLIAQQWQPGDRSLRDEDRYLFLETILSARRCLYISYVGQSIKDNSELPPSVLVSELLDAIQRGYAPEGGGPLEKRLVTRHRLQAFSSRYFAADSPLFSYSAENCRALLAKNSGSAERTVFMPTPLAEAGKEWRDVPLAKLLRFIVNPAQYFVENRLDIRLERIAEPLAEREPFAAAGLDSYQLKTDILEALLQGEPPEELLPRVRSLGILPPARHGDRLFADHVAEVARFARAITARIGSAEPLLLRDVELDLGEFRLHGRLGRIWPDVLVSYRCAKYKAKDLFRCWLEHLVLNAAPLAGYPRETLLIMTDRTVAFKKVDNAREILESVLALYWQGLTMPLPFYPEAALAYASAKVPWDLDKARDKWDDGYNGSRGEGQDPYFRLCFGRSAPFSAEFERISRQLLEPLLLHQVKVVS